MSYRGFARIRDDWTRKKFCFKSRTDPSNPCGIKTFYGKYLPESARNFHGPSNFKLSEDWQRVVMGMNPADAIKYLNRWGSGWRNNGESWQMEGLSFAGNVVYVDNLNLFGNQAYIRALDVTKSPPAALDRYGLTNLNYIESPWFAQVFTVITPFNTTVLPSFGDPKHDAQIYLFLMQDYRQRYMLVEDLEFFPPLPFSAQVVVGGLNVRREPAGEILRVAQQGDPLVIGEYRPRGSFVWGRIGVDAWVALAAPSINGWYSTSWQMQTLPPPV